MERFHQFFLHHASPGQPSLSRFRRERERRFSFLQLTRERQDGNESARSKEARSSGRACLTQGACL